MATLKQQNLAKAIIENAKEDKPKTAGELLESVGYAPTTAVGEPGRTIEQKGVQDELERLGFNEDAAKQVVADILSKGEKDTDRLKAADLIFKVQGSYAPEKHQVQADIKTNIIPEVLAMAEAEYKRILLSTPPEEEE